MSGSNLNGAKDPISLRIVSRFKKVFEAMGVEYELMYKILKIKFLMDERKTPAILKNESQGKVKNNTQSQVLVNLFLSFFLMLFLVVPGFPVLYKMSGILGMVMFYITLYMLSDFSTVMLDVRDRTIIGTKPVAYKTINAAKMVHVSIYLTRMVLSFVCLPLIASLFLFGPMFFLLFIGELILMTFLIMFFTSIIYYLLISFLDGEKLKDIINYIQMILSMVVIIGQQIIPRAFSIVEHKISYRFENWFYFLPPLWMASPFEILENGVKHRGYGVLGALSVIVPVLLMVVYTKFMAPYFEAKLIKLSSGENRKNKKKQSSRGLIHRIGDVWCKDPIERATYHFVLNMTKTERKYKLQLYPQLALFTILPWIMVFAFSVISDRSQTLLEQVRMGKGYFWLYFGLYVGTFALILISKSENYKGAWMYSVAPTRSPGPLFKGAVKALFIKYNILMIVIQSGLFIALFGIQIIPDVLVIILNSTLLFILNFKFTAKKLPFSTDFSITDASQGSVGLMWMIVLCVIGFGHLGLSYLPYANMIVGILSCIGIVVIWRGLFNIEWNECV